ncbi:hypothetical protein MTP99_019665 [Tenebrio molitor]|jgi:hypothetical protein|uniref:protein immune deficiency n=1 Tax=Tenebrio molitor TaxID=7067 RepID=UPI001C3B48F0|nr:hypothetical protein MTP99_019665 [Tenebrio molitor]CAH1378312.1 unnamed protein product [Tenebrio molitor]
MSGEYSTDDDLTTDAIPSPPRDEVNKEKDENVEELGHINGQPKMKTKSRVFKKPKKSTPTAFASVINISNANGIHVGSNYNVYLNKTENTQKTDYTITHAIKTLFDSTVPVDRKHLLFLVPHINEEWRNTARILDYSDGQISQFYEDYIRSGIKEVKYQLLLDWIQNEDDAATVARLSKALWETNQQDAVKRWSETFIGDKR